MAATSSVTRIGYCNIARMPLFDDANQSELRVAGWHSRGYLPHFDGRAMPQFITFHLADSVPSKVIKRWREELKSLKYEQERIVMTRFEAYELSDILHSLKSFSSHEANKLLHRNGQFWIEDYFDRYIRNEQHFEKTVKYIENNPVKAGLCLEPGDWPYSSAWFKKQKLADL